VKVLKKGKMVDGRNGLRQKLTSAPGKHRLRKQAPSLSYALDSEPRDQVGQWPSKQARRKGEDVAAWAAGGKMSRILGQKYRWDDQKVQVQTPKERGTVSPAKARTGLPGNHSCFYKFMSQIPFLLLAC
jgi:hypothetical protein